MQGKVEEKTMSCAIIRHKYEIIQCQSACNYASICMWRMNTLSCITISSRRHAPLEAAPFLKGAELEVVIMVVERAPSSLAPVPISVTRYKPLQ